MPCPHDRLNEDGYCRQCGTDMRSGVDMNTDSFHDQPETGAREFYEKDEQKWEAEFERLGYFWDTAWLFAEAYAHHRTEALQAERDALAARVQELEKREGK